MADRPAELLQGPLEMLVLKTLALEPMHGWGIAHRIQWMSNDVFLVTQGSLYPALVVSKISMSSGSTGTLCTVTTETVHSLT